MTQESVNVAQKAHIYAFSEDGPRGNDSIGEEVVNSHENLVLICHECHQKIDKAPDGGRYTAQLLQRWKGAHEARVELVTAIAPSKRSHVLLYGANVGDYSSPLRMQEAAQALFPHRYPAEASPISIGMHNSSWGDRDPDFWAIEEKNLRRHFDEHVKRRRAAGEIDHLSIFGLAPQPLLVLLGSLVTDIQPADVYPRRREPPTWAWGSEPLRGPLGVRCVTPTDSGDIVALALSVSATINRDRIRRVLGEDAVIWNVTVDEPHNDILQTPDQLREFRQALRPLLDRIKAKHGSNVRLHIFPALPAAAAIELGRIRMPKADTPWVIYDQVNDLGGFVRALALGEGGTDRGDAEVTKC